MEFFKKYQAQIVGVGIAAVVIIIGVMVSGPSNGSMKSAQETEGDSSLAGPLAPAGGAASAFETITTGGHTYQIERADWVFTPENGKTQVRIQVSGLKRDGIDFTLLPYRLGAYAGLCQSMDQPQGMVAPTGSRALMFAKCESMEGVRQFAVFQEGAAIVTHSRLVNQDTETQFEKIQTIDLAGLFQ